MITGIDNIIFIIILLNFHFGLLAAMNKVGTPHKCEEYINGSRESEFQSCPSFVSVQQTSPLKKMEHKCNVCTHSFTQAGSFSKHILIHDDIRIYQHDVCNKSL